MVLIAPGGEWIKVSGLHTKHHLGLDAELQKWVNTKNAHISVSEKFLVDGGYPVRNSEGDVDFQYHKVLVKDSTDNIVLYNIDQWFPNETVGLITCILGTNEQSVENPETYFE